MLITETACKGCDHVKVCKHSEEFLKAQEAVKNASISIDIPHGSKPISAIECVELIKLRCKFREHKVDAWDLMSSRDTDSVTTAGGVSYETK